MRLLVRLDTSPAGATILFSNTMLRGRTGARGLIVSLVLHVMLVAFSPVLFDFLRMLGEDEAAFNQRRFHSAPLALIAPARLYYSSPQPAADLAPLQSASQAIARRGGPRKSATVFRRRVQLPVLPEPPRVSSLVLQPNSRDAATLARLPAVSVWVAPNPVVPHKKFVLPGRTQAAASRPQLDAPPSLQPPNHERAISDLAMTGLQTSDKPVLPRPVSSTSPVRILDAPPAVSGGGGIAGSNQGDPAALISLGPATVALNAYAPVPSVVQAPATGGAGDGTGSASRARNGSSEGGAASGGGASGGGASGGGASAGFALEALPGTPPQVTRITKPNNGKFAFVVMGASAAESFPETAGMLSGKVVFTVYLGIGAAHDWVLQYCLPKPATARQSTGLEPPYPLLMLRPEVTFDSDSEHVLLHGMINEAGKFEHLMLAGESVVANPMVLIGTLYQWQFRPAARDGQPTRVEVLLIIPRQEP